MTVSGAAFESIKLCAARLTARERRAGYGDCAHIASLGGATLSAAKSNATIQRKIVTHPTHGNIWVPDKLNLKPDKPIFWKSRQHRGQFAE